MIPCMIHSNKIRKIYVIIEFKMPFNTDVSNKIQRGEFWYFHLDQTWFQQNYTRTFI